MVGVTSSEKHWKGRKRFFLGQTSEYGTSQRTLRDFLSICCIEGQRTEPRLWKQFPNSSSTDMMAIHHLAVGIIWSFVAHNVSANEAYANVTLHSPIMSARVFLPYLQDESEESQYYVGSRFEHGSMIGDVVYGHKTVYGREMWRTPHDASWPESGVGLASEFGCGDNGPTCAGKGDITNGVLGYETAKNGEPFLKIGVGALVKGSCPDCLTDETDDYKFNSPYKFYRQPKWSTLPSPSPNEVSFVHEESLGDLGYRIQKTIRLEGNILTVRTILSNSGKKQFSTPWYSHHFFTGDNDPVGPGYGIDLGLSEYGVKASTPLFDQPGIGFWAEDLNAYANVTMARDGSISMKMSKEIPEGVRLKAAFFDEKTITLTDGSFTLHAPNGLSVEERLPELQSQSRNPFIYAYNVYAERGTLSPEPMLLLYLQPAETTVWTQHLKFTSPVDTRLGAAAPFLSMFLLSDGQYTSFIGWRSALAVALCSAAFAGFYSMFIGTRRVDAYSLIPDAAVDVV